MDKNSLERLTRLIRYYILISTNAAQSGHTNSSLSAVELMTVLYFKFLRFDLDDPQNPANDRVIFSKGHASPLFYALYAAAGMLSEKDLLKYRSFDSNLEGHPCVRFPYTEVLTGSLGQGLSVGIGEAFALKMNYKSGIMNSGKKKNTHNSSFMIHDSIPRVYVLLGDGEMASGQVWEAIQYASFKKLNNIIGILDVNRLGQSEQTMLGSDVHAYAKRVASFGWRTYVIEDGHDLDIVDKAYKLALEQSLTNTLPAMIIGKTIKGKGVSFWEDRNGWHSKPLPREEFEEAVKDLGEIDKNLKGKINKPILQKIPNPNFLPHRQAGQILNKSYPSISIGTGIQISKYNKGELVATKKAFGNALEKLADVYQELVVLDGDVKNSLHTDQFENKYPDRFFQMYIAEQNMVSVAAGMSKRGLKPLVSTFGCFLTRAHDQMRLAALSDLTIYFNGSYAGVSLGKDGPSQMALEDMAMIRPILNSTLLYPADALATEKLATEILKLKGIVYMKTTREPTPVIYGENEEFPIGGAKVFEVTRDRRQVTRGLNDVSRVTYPMSPKVAVVACGITVIEALKTQEQLENEGIAVRVIDCYCLKPIDAETLKKAVRDTQVIITVEDHYAVGGLGDAVLEALADTSHVPVYKMAVTKTPRSGKPEELLEFEQISAKAIVGKILALNFK